MPNEGRICPHCGYGRTSQDITPDYECPRCGIIYSKYGRPTRPACAEENDSAIGTLTHPVPNIPDPTEEFDNSLPVGPAAASLSRRALAAIYTGAKAAFYSVLVLIPFYYAMLLDRKNISDYARNYSLLDSLVGLVGLYAFLFRPMFQDQTWGQEKFDVAICIRNDPDKPLGWTHWTLRYLGNIAATLVWPLTVAVFIYGLCARKDFPSLADRFSRTRQFEAEMLSGPFRRQLSAAIRPYAVALLICVVALGIPTILVSKYSKSPRDEARQAAAVKQQVYERIAGYVEAREEEQDTLDTIADLQQRHYSEEGFYAQNLESLIDRYGAGDQQTTSMIRTLIRDGSIRVEQINEGLEISVKTISHGWESRKIHP